MDTRQGVIAGGNGEAVGVTAALLVRLLRETEMRPVLAIDAHTGADLARHLGINPGVTVVDVMEQVLQVEEKSKELLLEQRIQQECLAEGKGFDLLTMGSPGGVEAHCYLNAVFCESLQNLKRNYRAVVTACEPELQHICRMNRGDIDWLLVLNDSNAGNLEKSANILRRAAESGERINRRIMGWDGDIPERPPSALAEISQSFYLHEVIGLPLKELLELQDGQGALMEAALPAACSGLLERLFRAPPDGS